MSFEPGLYSKSSNEKYHDANTAGEPGAGRKHEGSASRTDHQIKLEYPAEQALPGFHMKHALRSFPLEAKVAGRCRGGRPRVLGLAMGQVPLRSAAGLAIVDLNSKSRRGILFKAVGEWLTSTQKWKVTIRLKSWSQLSRRRTLIGSMMAAQNSQWVRERARLRHA
jgi:hypothetical protein